MMGKQTRNFGNSAAQLFLHSIAVALVTFVLCGFQVDLASTTFGISAESADRLFKALFRPMGMGLSIRSVVEAHAGRLLASRNIWGAS
jgi:hypothetical protein